MNTEENNGLNQEEILPPEVKIESNSESTLLTSFDIKIEDKSSDLPLLKKIKIEPEEKCKTSSTIYVPVDRSSSIQAERQKLPIVAEEQSIMEVRN